MSRLSCLTLLLSALSLGGASALDNGFGRTPLMGWMPYNANGCDINAAVATDILDDFVRLGFPDAGYQHYSVDCGWQAYQRNASTNALTAEPSAWPDGMRAFGDLVKSKGLKFGLYTDLGVYSCDTRTPLRPGSLGYEALDAKALADFGADYVKVDNCYITADQNAPKDPRTDFPTRYGKFTDELLKNGIEGVIICQWGTPYQAPDGTLQAPGEWAPGVGHQYRLSDDIASGWINVLRILNQAIYTADRNLTGPGAFADADMLEVGNAGMTFDEQATHFAFWALVKSPLFVSTNLKSMTDEVLAVLQNKDLIAANQDVLAKPVKLVQRWTGSHDLFAGPLAGDALVALLVEQANQTGSQTIDFADLGISRASVRNLWTGETQTLVSSYTTEVKAHGSIPLKLTDIEASTNPAPTYRYYEVEDGDMSNGAAAMDCSGCSGGRSVGSLSDAATVTVRGVRASSPSSTLLFDYANAEVQYLGAQIPNIRGATIRVNGGEAQTVSFPLTGYRWDDPTRGYKVALSGFLTHADNTVEISAATEMSPFAPDFDRFGVAQ